VKLRYTAHRNASAENDVFTIGLCNIAENYDCPSLEHRALAALTVCLSKIFVTTGAQEHEEAVENRCGGIVIAMYLLISQEWSKWR
jgi:hypothetical protein